MATSKKPTTVNRLRHARMVQNFHLIWLDSRIDEVNNDHCCNSIAKLQEAVNTVHTFIDVDECIDFITDSSEEKVFMIISEELSRVIGPIVQDISQVSSVYIFSENKVSVKKWSQQWSKIKSAYTDVTTLCEALKQAANDFEQNSVSISFVNKTAEVLNQNLDTLDCSFMYTQILKEILLTIHFEQGHFNKFLTYCREQLVGNDRELKNVDKLEKEYHDRKPIWWYTYQSFLYSMLNRALRLMEVDLIIKLGFFVRDLHNHITELYSKQYGGQNDSGSFCVYRGQGLSHADFDQLKMTQRGLLAFNNFLSTTCKYDVSLKFARRTVSSSNLVGVLFVMRIDPSISATPFANVGKVSCYQREEEILFSMHSVFRIGQVKQIDNNDRLWQVELTLTDDDDPQLHHLSESMQEETTGSTGWYRLGGLLIKLGQFDKAEELYAILLLQTTSDEKKAFLYHQLERIKANQGKYTEAVGFYEKSIAINQKILHPTHTDLTASYNNIGLVYDKMGEHSKALLYYKQALEIKRKVLPANHSDLATSYNNIGEVYDSMGEYSKALSFLERALDIFQHSLPPNHPNIKAVKENIEIVQQRL